MLFKDGVDNLAYREDKSADEPFKLRLSTDLSVARAEILRRRLNKREIIPDPHAHSLHNLEVEEDKIGYLEPANSKKKVWKTVERVPEPILANEKSPGFIFVGGIDASRPFSYVRPERLTYRTSRFAQGQYYTYISGYLFFFDNIQFIDVRAVFGDLLMVGRVKNAKSELCVPELRIPDDLYTAMKRLILEEESELSLNDSHEVKVNVDRN